MRRSSFLLLCALVPLGLSATAARAAGPAFVVEIDPAAPTTADLVTLKVKTFDQISYRIAAERKGLEIFINLTSDCVLAACPDNLDQVFEVPFGLLPAGNYYGYVLLEEGTDVAVIDFEVDPGQAQANPADFALEIAPAPPSDTDRTRLLITSETCAPAQFGAAARQGNTFVVDAALAEPPGGCTLAEQDRVLGGDSVDLGQLDPGAYVAELRSGGTLLASLPFAVQDAGEGLTLLGRYRASLTWKTPDGQTGTARPVALYSGESALFSFFNLANWEVLVKVLDGCAINGKRWVFLAAATDVEFTLTVTDLLGAAPPYQHRSPAGLSTPPLADTAAFACTP